MSAGDDRNFEQNARALLDESVTRASGRVRSRLNQARHAALSEIATARRRAFWRMPSIMAPAGGVLAAAVLAVVFLHPGAERGLAASVGYEDIELLSDKDGLDLLENWDGSFYEWAATQDEDGDSGATG